jgi:hypothetical protein
MEDNILWVIVIWDMLSQAAEVCNKSSYQPKTSLSLKRVIASKAFQNRFVNIITSSSKFLNLLICHNCAIAYNKYCYFCSIPVIFSCSKLIFSKLQKCSWKRAIIWTINNRRHHHHYPHRLCHAWSVLFAWRACWSLHLNSWHPMSCGLIVLYVNIFFITLLSSFS